MSALPVEIGHASPSERCPVRAKSRHALNGQLCPLLTQSGHRTYQPGSMPFALITEIEYGRIIRDTNIKGG